MTAGEIVFIVVLLAITIFCQLDYWKNKDDDNDPNDPTNFLTN